MAKKHSQSDDDANWGDDSRPHWQRINPKVAAALRARLERTKVVAPLSDAMRGNGRLRCPDDAMIALPRRILEALLVLAFCPEERPQQPTSKRTAKHFAFAKFLTTLPPEKRRTLHDLRGLPEYRAHMKIRSKTRRQLLNEQAEIDVFEDLTESGGKS